MASDPIFTDTIAPGVVAIATANANRDGTGTIGTLWTPGSDGGICWSVDIKATVTTTAGTVRLYVHNGSAYFLIREIGVPAIPVSATQPAYETTIDFGERGLKLPTGWSLRASTEKAENFNVLAHAEDF